MVENTIATQIKKLRKMQGLTQLQLAEKLSVSKQTVSNWETGVKAPRMKALQKLADIFNVKIGEITNASIAKKEDVSNNTKKLKSKELQRVNIPIISTITNIDSITAQENIDGYTEQSFVGRIPSGPLFAIRCKDHSMEPTLHKDAIVIIQEQVSFNDGEIVAVLLNSSEPILRNVKCQKDLIMLIPDNKDFDPVIINKANTSCIIGKAIRVSWDLD